MVKYTNISYFYYIISYKNCQHFFVRKSIPFLTKLIKILAKIGINAKKITNYKKEKEYVL